MAARPGVLSNLIAGDAAGPQMDLVPSSLVALLARTGTFGLPLLRVEFGKVLCVKSDSSGPSARWGLSSYLDTSKRTQP